MIITDYINEKSLSLNVDGFVINTFFSVFPDIKFNDEDILKIINNIKLLNEKRIIILAIDKIIDENELVKLKRFIKNFIDKVDYLIYSDYSVCSLVNIDSLNKLIYDSKTLVCSYHEANSIPTKTFISSEISQKELEDIINNTKDICINCFGLHQIMYSKRPLLSLYNNFINSKVLNQDTLYELKEEIRDDYYKIIENTNGTFIYTPYYFSLSSLSKELIDKVFIFRINSAFINYNDLIYIIDCYNKFTKGDLLDITSLLKNYFGNNICNGFLKDKLFLLKADENTKGDKNE